MAGLLALQSSLHCLAVFCSAIADGDKASTHSKGRFHHTSLRENSAHACGLAATAPARRKLPRWQPQCGPQPLTGSVTIVLSLFLPLSRTKSERRNRKTAAPRGAAAGPIAGRFAP